ncbi:uncharacterized protein BJ171DRAFT_485732 [Polychytrium aggregatum]|uniref:uncharacterized protein n=1 Tax=Polychytrium aggregatum TaxID=110093 RepID=UPI0022FE4555|nr:uncharacterized protein BJ171DRAFT_485732 [Polychytrium aggregatum]KAI9209207.1 hypothetical protein BJ171DRAFT_485732 [Polychytrium aggregatum]
MDASDILVGVGGLFWIACYICIIWINAKSRATYSMPIVALGLNFGWELTYSVFDLPRVISSKSVDPSYIINWIWVALDIGIVYLTIRNLKTSESLEFQSSWVRKHIYKTFFAIFVLSLSMHLVLKSDLGSQNGAAYSAYGINAYMSIAFVLMLLERRSVRGQNWFIAWSKFLGTFLASIGAYIGGTTSASMVWLYIVCAVVDVFYVILVHVFASPRISEKYRGIL